MTTTKLPKGRDAIILYTREFPHEVPMVVLRGKGTTIAGAWLSDRFHYEEEKLGWIAKMDHDELYDVLAELEDAGYTIMPAKTRMDPKHILEDFPG